MTRRVLHPVFHSRASVLTRERPIAHKTHILTFYRATPGRPNLSPD